MSGLQARNTTILADLGPLPDVVESDTDTSWRMFLELQAQHASGFEPTEPSSLAPLAAESAPQLTVEQLMVEARRLNRVCPKDRPWQQLWAMLRNATAAEPPAAIVAPESARTPQLVRRVRFRDQVEWAERHGQLQLVWDFMQNLAEDDWAHMGG